MERAVCQTSDNKNMSDCLFRNEPIRRAFEALRMFKVHPEEEGIVMTMILLKPIMTARVDSSGDIISSVVSEHNRQESNTSDKCENRSDDMEKSLELVQMENCRSAVQKNRQSLKKDKFQSIQLVCLGGILHFQANGLCILCWIV